LCLFLQKYSVPIELYSAPGGMVFAKDKYCRIKIVTMAEGRTIVF
jgi:hypothetical protein